jgi:hypothetical protein
MIGNNKMKLNEASMKQAVQMWLDSKTVSPIGRVTSVEFESGYDWFSVTISSPNEVENAK